MTDPNLVATSIEVAKPLLKYGIKEGLRIFKEVSSSYGKIKLQFFTVADFVDLPRMDELKVRLNEILTDRNFKKSGKEWHSEEMTIKEINFDYLPFPIEMDEEEKEKYEEFFEKNILLVKRFKLISIPNTKYLKKVGIQLGKILEKFHSELNPKNTFIELIIEFQDEKNSIKFKQRIKNIISKKSKNCLLRQVKKRVEIIITSLIEIPMILEEVENELYKNLLERIKDSLLSRQ